MNLLHCVKSNIDNWQQGELKAQFTMPELQEKQSIEWPLCVAENRGMHDMITGQDILQFLKIGIYFSDHTVKWMEHSVHAL